MAVVDKKQDEARQTFVTTKQGVCGGKPIIAGTRIRVEQIALEYDRMSWSADEIVQAHPHLTLAQIHAALAFYYENANSVNSGIRANEQAVMERLKRHPASVLDRQRA